MKLVIVNNNGETLGEVKLNQQLLYRPEILSKRLQETILASLEKNTISEDVDDRIVSNPGAGQLESLDEDTDIIGVPLNLKEACNFNFEKHIDAIVSDEEAAAVEHQKHRKYNIAQVNSKLRDTRYKRMPIDSFRFK
jgi:hypothetical protein